ncbi:MAG: hypothetical protein LBC73_00920 [Oscillospiraceae bacterium]|jgi:hypothetical protein|nr:hypothetical protein [Oscillospiraceae bacterium]
MKIFLFLVFTVIILFTITACDNSEPLDPPIESTPIATPPEQNELTPNDTETNTSSEDNDIDDDEVITNPFAPTTFPDGFHSYEHSGWIYEGYWENGLPNGQGTMTHDTFPATYTATFVNGLMNGTVTYQMGDSIWTFEVIMGYAVDSKTINDEGLEIIHQYPFNVPPWGP